MHRLLFALLLLAAPAIGQIDYRTQVKNKPLKACVGTPGATAGVRYDQCQTAAGATYTCNQDTCSAAGHWVAVNSVAASPTNCDAGQAPTGINAAGAAQNCTAYLQSAPTVVRGLSFTFDGGGAAIPLNKTAYIRVPFACTLVNWSIGSTTAETVTIKTWRVATGGTALPTSGDSISTSGVSLSSGTAVYSATVTDFTSTAIAANDWLAATLTAVTASQLVNFVLGCQQ